MAGERRRVEIKICGVTRPEDARWLATLDIDAVGINFHPSSPRFVSNVRARAIVEELPRGLMKVGVFVDRPAEEIEAIIAQTGITGVQLHGRESAAEAERLRAYPLLKAFRIRGPESLAELAAFDPSLPGEMNLRYLLDAYHPGEAGGTGQTWDWRQISDQRLPRDWFLAGGLRPDNVAGAIEVSRPNGVDVASGVEREPGIKDRGKVEAFIAAVRS